MTTEREIKLPEPVYDKKFVVFKRDEVQSFSGANFSDTLASEFFDMAIEDAVVIRTRDSFAGPALHSYAASIGVAARVIAKAGRMGLAKDMLNISDYFHARAVEADEYAQLDADHIPD